jgi:hypothetical protein
MALGYCRECGGKASTEAPACAHCGAANPTGRYHPAPVHAPAYALAPRPSNGIAAVLSLVLPGAGQMYKGHVGSGIGWMVCTFLGYLALVLPGLVLHGLCIANAASREPA